MTKLVRFTFCVATLALMTITMVGCTESESPKSQSSKPVDDTPSRTNPETSLSSDEIMQQRESLDQTVWTNEVDAQKHELVFVNFWDEIRNASMQGREKILAKFPFKNTISFGNAGEPDSLESGISIVKLSNELANEMSPKQWEEFVTSFGDQGYQIIQTEWHHSRFVPAQENAGAKSTISFAIHAAQPSSQTLCGLKGDLEVQWAVAAADDSPQVDSVQIKDLSIQTRSKGGILSRILTAQHKPDEFVSAYPILVYDLNSDGLSEIVIPRWNRVYWNRGNREFDEQDFLKKPIKIWEAGVLSDFDGDGNVDFVTVGKDGYAHLFRGEKGGEFPNASERCADVTFEMPTVITTGDTDGDGDLDLWMTQYKLSFDGGQMPTPYYDANDGHPSYFLVNDGNGKFQDQTESAGLAELRNRRTYSASFVDLDEDNDLDLMNVSDYAGLDIYENVDGKFKLATEEYVDERHFFGMGHTIGDYNRDGLIDFYVIGMSSTTARRLDRMKLGREDRPDIHPMRSTMGYGNRLYLGTKDKKFKEDPQLAAAVARTGWSWGVTSFDFNLDGDLDIYVANGHRSGKSCQDYCSTFWRHDIYTGDSNEDSEVLKVFESTLSEINNDEISWNGYEKNVLFLNQPEREGMFVNSSFMFGAAYAFDARCVISDDLDKDGWPDLIVAQSQWDSRGGFPLSVHVMGNDIRTGEKNNWLAVQLVESPGPGFSPNGAKVVIEDNLGNRQTRWIVTGDSFYSQHATVAHFGLGTAKYVKTVEVTWPGGETRKYPAGATVNKTLTISGQTNPT